MCCINPSISISLSSMYALIALILSVKLCGGILVAIPTAIPEAPLTSNPGILVGSTVGSFNESSKLSCQSTVSLSISESISSAILRIRTSVYRIAAGLSPSTLPKLPWPSTSMYRSDQSCAIRTMVSYTELSPCGWYYPIHPLLPLRTFCRPLYWLHPCHACRKVLFCVRVLIRREHPVKHEKQ